jgi:hypothetical protein
MKLVSSGSNPANTAGLVGHFTAGGEFLIRN